MYETVKFVFSVLKGELVGCLMRTYYPEIIDNDVNKRRDTVLGKFVLIEPKHVELLHHIRVPPVVLLFRQVFYSHPQLVKEAQSSICWSSANAYTPAQLPPRNHSQSRPSILTRNLSSKQRSCATGRVLSFTLRFNLSNEKECGCSNGSVDEAGAIPGIKIK